MVQNKIITHRCKHLIYQALSFYLETGVLSDEHDKSVYSLNHRFQS